MDPSEENNTLLEKLQKLEAQEALHRQALADILTFSTRLTRNSNLKTLYRECNTLARKILNLDYSTLMILSDDKKSLVIRDTIGFPVSMIDTFSLLEGQGLSTHVVKAGEAAVVRDFNTETRFDVPPVVFKEKIISALAVPMMIMEEVFGIMIGHTRTRRDFLPEEISVYQSIANQSAVAIQNVMHFNSLQESRKRFRALIDRAGDAIFLSDMEGHIRDVNEMACHSLGYSRKELLQMTVFDVDPQSVAGDHPGTLWANLSADIHLTINSRHRRKDGSEFPVEIRICLLETNGDNFILGFARDISDRELSERERRRLQEKLNQAQKMESIGTLAGGIAHDFNNILTSIFGNLELALLNAEENNELRYHLAQVSTAAIRARDMVQQILAFSRSGSEEVAPLQVDITIKEALKLIRSSIPTTVEIRDELHGEGVSVLANPIQIHQILINLCTNSYHAMRETGGVLSISLNPLEISREETVYKLNLRPGKYLKLSVSDTGHGIDPAIIDRIFEPYFTTKDVGEGTGMGLSVVHGIVTAIGGHISVYSEPDRGTTVNVFFPVIAREAIQGEDSTAAVIPTGSEKILLVDDEQAVGNAIKGMLLSLGYEVEVYNNPVKALERFIDRPDSFDLLITDMTMPRMTGDRLAREILIIRPAIPVILCTGFSDLIDEKAAKEIGIREFVTKPVTIQTFARTVRDALDR